VLADRWLADAELFRNQHAADPVPDEVAVDLGGEMHPWSLQPFQDQQPPAAGEGAENGLDVILVSVGGGGLVAGIAAWYRGRIKVVGVEPILAPTLTRAFEAGRPVDAEAGGLAADSLAPRRVGGRVFPIVRKFAPQTVLVSDDAIGKDRRRSGAPCASWPNRAERPLSPQS